MRRAPVFALMLLALGLVSRPAASTNALHLDRDGSPIVAAPSTPRPLPPPVAGPAGAAALAVGTWSEEMPTRPEGSGAIYDPVRDRMLEVRQDQVWALGLKPPYDWTPLATTGTPPPSPVQRVIYDASRDRVLAIAVAGGAGSEMVVVWSLALSTMKWTALAPAGTAPTTWWYPSFTYDPVRQRGILIGGYSGSMFTNEVWALSLAGTPAWTPLAPAGTPPPGRNFHVAVYDPARDRILVQGGENNPYFWGLSDLWELDLAGTPAWHEIVPSGALPSGFAIHTGVWDAARDRMLLFGGVNGGPMSPDVWSFVSSPSPAWVRVDATGDVAGRMWHTVILDPVRDAMVIFGGRGPQTFPYFHDVVALQLGGAPAWVGLSPLPPSRTGAATALDTQRGHYYVFGGYDGDGRFLADLWRYDLRGSMRWSRLDLGGGPTARSGAKMIYDPDKDRLLLYGGYDGAVSLADVWSVPLAGPAWVALPDGPGYRHGHSFVLDELGRRALVFGGATRAGCCALIVHNDVWTMPLDGDPTWTRLVPSGTWPAPRFEQAMAFDRANDRLIVHGGSGGLYGDSLCNDLWQLQLGGGASWSPITPGGDTTLTAELGRYGHGLVDDDAHARMLLFGGSNGAQVNNDVWQLDLAGEIAWEPVTMSGTPPEPRAFAGVDFDVDAGQLLVFGGGGPGNDLWRGQFDVPVPVEISLVEASAGAGVVHLSWSLDARTHATVEVERRTASTGWTTIGSTPVGGDNLARFDDAAVAPGVRYGYRVRSQAGAGVAFGPETWVDVPAAAVFALAGTVPNPAPASRLAVAFSLPDAQPARLELFDLAGRRLVARDVGVLGAGAHVLRLDGPATLRPGMYWLGLTQGARRASARVVLVN